MEPQWLKRRCDRELKEQGCISSATAIALEQQENIKYVGYTRTKHALHLLDDGVERVL